MGQITGMSAGYKKGQDAQQDFLACLFFFFFLIEQLIQPIIIENK